MEETTETPLTIDALRYVATTEGGRWQVRCGTDVHQVSSLRQFQQIEGIERLASRALSQPATWIAVGSDE